MKKTFYFAIPLILMVVFQPLSADVIITVEVDPPVNATDTASVSFFATSNTSQRVTGFNLPIDIGRPVGIGLPSELSFLEQPNDPLLPNGPMNNNNSIINEIGGVDGALNTGDILSLNNADAIVNVQGFAPVTLSTTPTLIFDLLLDVSGSALPGSFPVTINNGDRVGEGFSFNISDDSEPQPFEIPASQTSIIAGSVNIVASVPEPSSMILAVAAIGGLGLRRRR